jgi:uncharacterized membrane protein YwzB
MDIIEFHELMRNKYAERRWRQRRVLRVWILCNAALVTFLSSFVLAYLRFSGK